MATTDVPTGGGEPVAWQEIREKTPVATSDGVVVGRIAEVLGSADEDLFHGVEVRLADGDRRVLVLADDVTDITTAGVTVRLTGAQMQALPEHTEEHAFRLGWRGIIRKHPAWVEDKDWGR
jgi:hypothetical protein